MIVKLTNMWKSSETHCTSKDFKYARCFSEGTMGQQEAGVEELKRSVRIDGSSRELDKVEKRTSIGWNRIPNRGTRETGISKRESGISTKSLSF